MLLQGTHQRIDPRVLLQTVRIGRVISKKELVRIEVHVGRLLTGGKVGLAARATALRRGEEALEVPKPLPEPAGALCLILSNRLNYFWLVLLLGVACMLVLA